MILTDLVFGAAAVALLSAPGAYAARRLGWPAPIVMGFIVGVVALVEIAIALDLTGVPLSLAALLTTWLAASGLGLLALRRLIVAPLAPPAAARVSPWALLLVPAVVVVAYRATLQPLFGADTIFRWGYLAEQIFARESLDFYPPVSAADYTIYSWADGIPPAVALLYTWVFKLVGDTRASLTAAPVLIQFILLLAAVHALARRFVEARGAMLACVVVCASPIALWGTAMGQETGLLAISLVAMLLFIEAAGARDDRSGLVVAAAFAAALGGLTREYGLACIALGGGLLLWRRTTRPHAWRFVGVASALVVPWYVRNWIRTGNPFFNLDIGGLFPVNAQHNALMEAYQSSFGWSNVGWPACAVLLQTTLAVLLLAAWGMIVARGRASALVVAMLMVAVLWAWSVGYTAAGFTYALRVLAPALAVGAVFAAIALDRFASSRARSTLVAIALLGLGIDAAVRTLVLPVSAYRIPPREWLDAGGALIRYHERPIYRQIANSTGDGRVLTLGPNALLTRLGARTVPLWSPEMAFLWQRGEGTGAVAQKLAGAEVKYVLLNTGPVNHGYIMQLPFFNEGIAGSVLQPMWADEDMALYRIASPQPTAAAANTASP